MLADDWEISVTAALEAALSELDGMFALREEQRRAKKAFLSEEDIFALVPAGFWQEFS